MDDDNEPTRGPGFAGENWELLFPFLCVESRGGPFDDRAFTAGVQLGSAYAALFFGHTRFEQIVYAALVPTLDLVAMNFGYKLVTHPLTEDGDTVHIHLSPQAPSGQR